VQHAGDDDVGDEASPALHQPVAADPDLRGADHGVTAFELIVMISPGD
jgi:hypothetical protein